MMARVEMPLYITVLLLLGALLLGEGRTRALLEGRIGVTPQELYRTIGKGTVKVQIVDVRPDLEEGYVDTHIPGAIPMPGCDAKNTPPAALERIVPSVPTVVVSEDGSLQAFEACAAKFTNARNLSGGLAAWVDANLPEDSGDYVPPKAGAGGGCL